MGWVDSHCHVSPVWYEPVESLLFQMERHGVEQAVLVQMFGQNDNEYLFDCARRYPGRFAPVVIVDCERPDAVERLERLAEQGAAGVRLEATSRSPGDDPYAIWRAAERLGVAVSCNGEPGDFAADAFAELVETVPGLPIVVEHLAGAPVDDPWQGGLLLRAFAIGRFPNVYLKFHGLGEFCRRVLPTDGAAIPFAQPIPPVIEEAARYFGPSRLMWGSDYPPVSGREGYGNALNLPMRLLAGYPGVDLAATFGDTARAVFFARR